LATSVGIYTMPKLRSQIVTSAMHRGAVRSGYVAKQIALHEYDGPRYDMACFYGFEHGMEKVFADYRNAGKPIVYIDLGYFGRRTPSRFHGYHKIILNGRHPFEYHRMHAHGHDRADKLGVVIHPWRPQGDHIVLCGMSERAAKVLGFKAEEWEREAVRKMRQVTDRRIIYRPKPSWKDARPIEGTVWGDPTVPLFKVMEGAHSLVTYNSNAAIEALMWGFPVVAVEGIASDLAQTDVMNVEQPRRDGDRRRLLNDLSYVQWTVAEMSAGLPWMHMRNEGLIP
jgi:hypothetical protein